MKCAGPVKICVKVFLALTEGATFGGFDTKQKCHEMENGRWNHYHMGILLAELVELILQHLPSEK